MAGIDYLAEAEGEILMLKEKLRRAVQLLAYVSIKHKINLWRVYTDAALEYKSVSYILALTKECQDGMAWQMCTADELASIQEGCNDEHW